MKFDEVLRIEKKKFERKADKKAESTLTLLRSKRNTGPTFDPVDHV